MCAPVIRPVLSVAHDDEGVWTVVYSEEDSVAQDTSEVVAKGWPLPVVLRRLAKAIEERGGLSCARVVPRG